MINKVSVTGNISKILNKNNVVSLLLARHEQFEQNGELREKTDFFWVKTSQKVFDKQTLKVGDLVKADGKLSGGQYQDKNDNWQNNLYVFAFALSPYSEKEEIEGEALPTPDETDEVGF